MNDRLTFEDFDDALSLSSVAEDVLVLFLKSLLSVADLEPPDLLNLDRILGDLFDSMAGERFLWPE